MSERIEDIEALLDSLDPKELVSTLEAVLRRQEDTIAAAHATAQRTLEQFATNPDHPRQQAAIELLYELLPKIGDQISQRDEAIELNDGQHPITYPILVRQGTNEQTLALALCLASRAFDKPLLVNLHGVDLSAVPDTDPQDLVDLYNHQLLAHTRQFGE